MASKSSSPGVLLFAVTSATACATDPSETASADTAQTSAGETPQDDDLDDCRALPAADAAQWIEGPAIESSAVSTAARIEAAGARTWDLSLDLLRLTDPAMFPSVASAPTSMTLSMGLAYRRWQGSGTPCADSIHERMHFSEAGDSLHQTLGASARELESRATPGDAQSDALLLTLRQSMWELVPGSTAGVDLTGDADYGATRNAVSTGGPEALPAIREVINCVFEKQSAGLLVDFLPPNVPDLSAASFDIDVAFLQAPWATALAPGPSVLFSADDGSASALEAVGGPMTDARFHDDEQATVLELPLRNTALAVAFVMPKRTAHASLADFVAATDADELRAMIDGASGAVADVTIPVVRIPDVTIDYFGPFGFACDPDIELSKVLHGATIEIDDKGIRAAAATVSEGGVDCSGGGPPEVVVVLDHPFAFFVHDRVTGHVLYSGRFAGY